MVEPPRPAAADTPGSDDESTIFMPTQTNAGVGEDERGPVVEPVVVIDDERSWRHNPWLWVAVAVVVLLAVPLLADYSKGRRLERAAAARAAQASAPAAVEPAASSSEPAPQPTAAPAAAGVQPGPTKDVVVVTRPAGQPPRSMADGPRQMVTKCIENGRVVYTQTGACAGSVTAVPIDADKNVVGADRPGRERAGAKAP